ncbi:MAG: ABC transporter ATP-binding protein [Candidatus Asgardarchaeia archaeon]
MLEVKNLYSGYGKFKVLFDINLEAKEKEITVVVGPNGAGKTTLMRSIVGLATIHSGEIKFQGENITNVPPHKVAKIGIALVPQLGNVFASLTVYANLKIAAYTRTGENFDDEVNEILELFPAIKPFLHRKAGTLSGGERRMLAIAMGLIRKPRLMLLDEVTMDLAPIIAKRVLEKVVELRDTFGITIVLVEQMAKRALEIGDSAYLLVSGVIKFSGNPKELLENKELSKLYLGI